MQRSGTEQYIVDQLEPTLWVGEKIHACGAFVSRSKPLVINGYLAAVTDHRLFLISTRAGAERPLLENHRVVAINRSEITGWINQSLFLASGRSLLLNDQPGARTHIPSHNRLLSLLDQAHGHGAAEEAARVKRARDQWKRAAVVLMNVVVLLAIFALARS